MSSSPSLLSPGLWGLTWSNAVYPLSPVLFLYLHQSRIQKPTLLERLLELYRIYAWYIISHCIVLLCSVVWHVCFYGVWCASWEGTFDHSTTNIERQGAMVMDMLGVFLAIPSILQLFANSYSWNALWMVVNFVAAIVLLALVPGFVDSIWGGVSWSALSFLIIFYQCIRLLRIPMRGQSKTKRLIFRIKIAGWFLLIVCSSTLAAYFKDHQDDVYDVYHPLWHVFSGLDSWAFVGIHYQIVLEQDKYLVNRVVPKNLVSETNATTTGTRKNATIKMFSES